MKPRMQVPPRDLVQLPWQLPEPRNVAKHKERVWRTWSVFTLQALGLLAVLQLLGMIAIPLPEAPLLSFHTHCASERKP